MHWRHRFPMPFLLSCPDTGIGSEDQTQSLEIELAIPFVPNRDPPDAPQQSELGGRALSSIRMKSLPIAAAWADIWIKGLIPISKTSYGSSMEHMQCWIDGI
ncbi:hypothetical protein TNCV_2983321 [Trichonephila clavipes]|nr:hypothetical protein TNCV_2983321 [Trichonephila clavipes]